ncbi:MAG: serine/threonine protein kinase [bacterium]|nr:serine/threonine protein kinase [bacterium]
MKLFNRKKAKAEFDSNPDEGGVEDATDESTLELTTVGPYKIVAPVGRGGMGTVYKAIDPIKDKTIAIKVLDRRYDVDKKRRRGDYLGREILVAAQLSHENIIKMHDKLVEQEDAEGNVRRCLLMEYIDGHNLRKHIDERDLSNAQMLQLCVRLCHGLDFLHQNGVVHRDIKPENFLFSRDLSQVKIVDFGLSKSSATWRTRWIREGGGGTRRYMSPEQLRKEKLDARSDIFSFGLTMYELFAGRHPCNGSDSYEIMKQIRSKKYKFEAPSKHNASIPPQVDRGCLKALRRKPERRYQSVTQMLLDLTRKSESRI